MAVSLHFVTDIDQAVRDSIDYALDIDVYGQLDRWGLPGRDIDGDGRWEDDCDGSALLARALMRGKDVPGLPETIVGRSPSILALRSFPADTNDLALALCHTRGLVGRVNHLVLLVAVDDGHWYTCGDTGDRFGIRPYQDCPYSWFEWISQPGDWRRFG